MLLGMVTLVVAWCIEWVISLFLGSGVVKAKDLLRLRKIKRHAPSATLVKFQVALTQEDYDRLPEKEDDTMYTIIDNRK